MNFSKGISSKGYFASQFFQENSILHQDQVLWVQFEFFKWKGDVRHFSGWGPYSGTLHQWAKLCSAGQGKPDVAFAECAGVGQGKKKLLQAV